MPDRNKQDFRIISVTAMPDGRDEVRVVPAGSLPTDQPTVWRVTPPHDLRAGDPCTIEDCDIPALTNKIH